MLVLLPFLLTGCDGKESIDKIGDLAYEPELSGDSLHVYYSKNGRCEMEVIALELRSYNLKEKKVDEFPKGIKVYAYDSQGGVNSMIEAGYAIYFREKKLWDARQNVVAVNEKGDSIESERIFWNEVDGRVYTDENVRIRTKDATLFGKGFESDDRLNNWVILRPTGIISVRQRDTIKQE